MSDPIYGLSPDNPNANPPNSSNSGNGNSPAQSSGSPVQGTPNESPENAPGSPSSGSQANGQPGTTQQQGTQPAPTFMNGSIPGTEGPMIQNGTAPNNFAAPMAGLFQQAGYPDAAASLASAVYMPFGLSMFNVNPFQIAPAGFVAFTGAATYATNVDYASSNPTPGVFYTISPSAGYSTFDQYGFLSAFAGASLYEYTSGNLPSYLQENGSLSAGTYLGNRVYVGVREMVLRGSDLTQTGTPIGFLNGVSPYLYNILEGEIGIALTPKITFIQTANDFYFDGTSLNAGISNIQSLGETLNYRGMRNYLTGTYSYSQGSFSIFPNFISHGGSALATHSLSETTQLGAGGNYTIYSYAGGSSLSFTKGAAYGQFSHKFTPEFSASFQGGWNEIEFQDGELFQDPLININFQYVSGKGSLGINAGEFMINETNYGVELGPANVMEALAYLYYSMSPKTYLAVSGGITNYEFFKAPTFSNNFFQTLTPNGSYSAQYISQRDGVYWRARKWLLTGLAYQLIDFSTNVPQETVLDNEFIASVTLMFPF